MSSGTQMRPCRRTIVLFWAVLVLSILAAPASAVEPIPGEPPPPAEEPPPVPQMKWGDDDNFIRLLTWQHFWTRAIELNPGSLIQNDDEDWAFDTGLRRSRFLLFGKYQRLVLVFHIGINNQTFNNERKPQVFVHGAWGAIEVIDQALAIGTGLHFWRGISRLTNASTSKLLALDTPILNWPTIETTDQFARQLGIFAKGQLGRLDYRVSLNRPFAPNVELIAGGPINYNPEANTWASAGYLQYFFLEPEDNTLPYMPGTYLGTASVFTIGAGWHWQPDAMARRLDDEQLETDDLLALGVDVFADLPLGDGSALSAYGVFYYFDMGPDFVRNIGVMNLAEGGSSFNGAGNAYPTIGTGEHLYVQGGYLFAQRLGTVQLQPYAAAQLSSMEGLEDLVVVPNVGANWYIYGQTAKVTTNYRNRPIFDLDRQVDSRAHEFIVQLQVSL